MFGQYYHGTIRKYIIAFGNLFNDIVIARLNTAGVRIQAIEVPIAYGPKEKWLVRLKQDPNLEQNVGITLPRIGFEIQNLSYDATRKLNRVQKFKKVKSGRSKTLESQYMPVPYNLDVQLYILAKQSDDALQIIEQILPFFQPDYTITINDMAEMGIKRDVPVILNGITYEDDYIGEFETRRAIIYTLTFTVKFYLYGPVTAQSVIKKVQVDQYSQMPEQTPPREQRYTVTPKPESASADDDFGFNEETSFFTDSKVFDPETGKDIPLTKDNATD
mgnify:CR=1 FL=1